MSEINAENLAWIERNGFVRLNDVSWMKDCNMFEMELRVNEDGLFAASVVCYGRSFDYQDRSSTPAEAVAALIGAHRSMELDIHQQNDILANLTFE
jgi:hypothetical protein